MDGDNALRGVNAHTVEILACRGGVGHICLFAGPIRGCFTHWHQGRSWYCPGESACLAALHRLHLVWKGYAPIRQWLDGPGLYQPDVLEVTEHLDLELAGRNLVGEIWLISRDGGRKKSGPVGGAYMGREERPDLVQWFDVIPAIEHLWHVKGVVLGVQNPIKPRMVLSSTPGPRPAGLASPKPAPAPAPSPNQLEALRAAANRGGAEGRLAARTLAARAENAKNGTSHP